MAIDLSQCVIVLKSCAEETTLHKELRQVYEVVAKLVTASANFDGIPKKPTQVFIETYRKPECNDLWIKIFVDGTFLLCDVKCPSPRIFDFDGNIRCPSCSKIIDVTLPSSPHFAATHPRIVIHVKQETQANVSEPTYDLQTSLLIAIANSLEVLVQCICEGWDLYYKESIVQAVITQVVPEDTDTDHQVKLVIDCEENYNGRQMNVFSDFDGYILCDICGLKYL